MDLRIWHAIRFKRIPIRPGHGSADRAIRGATQRGGSNVPSGFKPAVEHLFDAAKYALPSLRRDSDMVNGFTMEISDTLLAREFFQLGNGANGNEL